MTTLREAAQMAIDALINAKGYIFYNVLDDKGNRYDIAIEALRAALAQPEQEPQGDDLSEIANLFPNCSVVKLDNKMFLVQPKTKESNERWATRRKQIDGYFAVSQEVLAQPEQEPVGNTITFMTRAIFNVVANHQEINGGYFIADGDVAAFVDRLAKVINSTFEPLKPKNTAPPQREWQRLTDEEIYLSTNHIDRSERGWAIAFARAIEAKLREKNQ